MSAWLAEPDPLVLWLQRYLAYAAEARGVSARTLANYRRDIGQFVAFLRAEDVAAWAQVGRPLLRRWLSRLRERGFTAASIARQASEVRTFLRFLADEGVVAADPFEGLRMPRPPRVEREVLTRAEVVRLLEAPGPTPLGLRDRAVLEVLYATGMRVTELSRLELRQIDLPGRQILRWDRAGHTRPAFLGRSAVEALERYLASARPKLLRDAAERALFLGRSGRKLSGRAVEHLVVRHARAAGLSAAPGDLRAACAAHLREGGATAAAVRQLLGTLKSNRPRRAVGTVTSSQRERQTT